MMTGNKLVIMLVLGLSGFQMLDPLVLRNSASSSNNKRTDHYYYFPDVMTRI